MNQKLTELERKLCGKEEWRKETDEYLSDYFVCLGFECPKDFMEIRVYDFLNLDMVDNNRAEEMSVALSVFLFPERERYSKALNKGTTETILNWLKEHEDLSKVLLRELICDNNLSLEDMLYVFDCISMSFYHGEEYNGRKYRYSHIDEIGCTPIIEREDKHDRH